MVGEFGIEKMPNTEIRFIETKPGTEASSYQVLASDGAIISDLTAGFDYDGSFFPVIGWVAYSRQPYKDDLMAGIRIYCRGKIAAQTHIFNMKAGFTGEYDIRSYLVGYLQADWLDLADDLIRTDRQDILWSHELGQAFEAWGQSLIRKVGSIAREPRRKKAWEQFKEISKIEERVNEAFPGDEQEPIRQNTIDMAKAIATTAREDELRDPELVESFVQLSLLLGPHITLDQKLREASESKDAPLLAITGILQTARIAELSSFGRIAEDRVRVIKTVEELKDDKTTLEEAFQKLISAAPWLVNPQWSPITANQSFATLKKEFQKYFKQKTKKELTLDDFASAKKRADFILSNQDNIIEIIEIKKPAHSLENQEMERINTYVELMEQFLDEPANAEFKGLFPKFHVTLVCDSIKLKGVHNTAFQKLISEKQLTHINWGTFLLRTKKMHEEFLKEAERQRRIATKDESK